MSLTPPASFYVTTPIYYVNDVPHLGTAYTTIAADALARFHKLCGEPTFFLTGTDEHGLKLQRIAEEQKLDPQIFVDRMSAPFKEAWPKLNVEYSNFIRTTDSGHKDFAQSLWSRVFENGFLYEGDYEAWYCVGCESYKTEKELSEGNICNIHLKPVEKLKEATYFFKLKTFEEKLLQLYKKRPDFIRPESRFNEVVSFVSAGLDDLSVSRTSLRWGIPVPNNPTHVMYVWFDALTNYLSALQRDEQLLKTFWPPWGRVVHLVGKDILRFHAVYWPAFLLAAGYTEKELPSQIYAHGFLTVDGLKMSKSLRNSVNPIRLAEKLGADVLRYQLLRGVVFGQDGDFSHSLMLERYNADLGKNLGNLLHRTLGLCKKLSHDVVPDVAKDDEGRSLFSELELDLQARVTKLCEEVKKAWGQIEPHRALEATWEIAQLGNQYVDRAAPWAAAKAENFKKTNTTLATLLALLETLSRLISPVLPEKAKAMRAQLGLAPLLSVVGEDHFPHGLSYLKPGHKLCPGEPIFPTYDAEAIQSILAELVPIQEPQENEKMASVSHPASPEDFSKDENREMARPPLEQSASVQGSEIPPAENISITDFSKIDLRAGVIVSAEKIPKKDKLLKLLVAVGETEPRQVIAGLGLSFSPGELVGKRVIVVVNLPPRDFGKNLISHGMILASGSPESLHLASISDEVKPGSKLK